MKTIRALFVFGLVCMMRRADMMQKDLTVTLRDGKHTVPYGECVMVMAALKILGESSYKPALIELVNVVHRNRELDDPKVIELLKTYNLLDERGGIRNHVRSIIASEYYLREGILYTFKEPVHALSLNKMQIAGDKKKILSDAQLPREDREHRHSVPDFEHPSVIKGAVYFTIHKEVQNQNKMLQKLFRQIKDKQVVVFKDVHGQLLGTYTYDAHVKDSEIEQWARSRLDHSVQRNDSLSI